MVKVSADRNQPWSGLIPEGLNIPGVVQRSISVGDSVIKKVYLNR